MIVHVPQPVVPRQRNTSALARVRAVLLTDRDNYANQRRKSEPSIPIRASFEGVVVVSDGNARKFFHRSPGTRRI